MSITYLRTYVWTVRATVAGDSPPEGARREKEREGDNEGEGEMERWRERERERLGWLGSRRAGSARACTRPRGQSGRRAPHAGGRLGGVERRPPRVRRLCLGGRRAEGALGGGRAGRRRDGRAGRERGVGRAGRGAGGPRGTDCHTMQRARPAGMCVELPIGWQLWGGEYESRRRGAAHLAQARRVAATDARRDLLPAPGPLAMA